MKTSRQIGLIVSIFAVVACQATQPVAYNQSMSKRATSSYQSSTGTLRYQKPKLPQKLYQGPLELKIDPSLLGKDTPNRNTFKITALQTGEEIWRSELFTRTTGQPDEFDITFEAPAKDYILQVENGDAEGKHRISSATVTINGQDVVIPDDFNQQVALVEKPLKLTLQPQQQVHIRLTSKPGSFLRLVVYEDPQDVTFDPADPSTLGDLFPDVPGNKNIPIPETVESVISLNGHVPEPVSTGQIAAQILDLSPLNIEAVANAHNAQVVFGPINGWFLLQPNMTAVDVTKLESNIRTLNAMATNPDAVIKTGAFGNLESARTFTFATSLALDPRVGSVSFNPTLEENSSVDTVEQELESYKTNPPIVPSAQNSWWLNERSTWVTHAWEYALGYIPSQRRSVRVAVIDDGFSGLGLHTQPGRDMEGQVAWEEGGIVNQYQVYKLIDGEWKWVDDPNGVIGILRWDEFKVQKEDSLVPADQESLKPHLAKIHGTETSATIAAKFRNGTGIAGVAPYAKIVPYKLAHGDWYELIEAVKDISFKNGSQKIDVINISKNRNATDPYLYNYFDTAVNMESWIKPLQDEVQKLSVHPYNIVFVNSAGNHGWDADSAIPGTKLFPEMITVGALADDQNISTPPLSGEPQNLSRWMLTTDPSQLAITLQIGSNFGSFVSVWAPGADMLSLSPEYKEKVTINGTSVTKPSSIYSWQATSAAAPIISGIIALMKSIDPLLTGHDVKQRLINTSRDLFSPDDLLRTDPLYFGPELLNSECIALEKDAKLKKHISCGDVYSDTLHMKVANALNAVKDLTSNKAQTYHGILSPIQIGGQDAFRLENSSAGYAYTLRAGESYKLDDYLAEYQNSPTNPKEHIKIKDLKAQFAPGAAVVDVTGFLDTSTNELQVLRVTWIPTPIPTATPTPTPMPTATPISSVPPDRLWFVRAFNIDDRVNVIVNDNFYAIQNQRSGDTPTPMINITPLLKPYPQINTVRFQVFNDSNQGAPGTTWGFELISTIESGGNPDSNPQTVYKDVRGWAGHYGARLGDPSFGLVYDQTLYIYKNGLLPGDGTFTVRTYGISPGDRFELVNKSISGNPILASHSDADGWNKDTVLDDTTQLLKFPTKSNDSVFNIFNQFPDARMTWGMDIYHGGTLVYRHRDGEREAMALRPAGALFNYSAPINSTSPVALPNYNSLPVYNSLLSNKSSDGNIDLNTYVGYNKFMFWVLP